MPKSWVRSLQRRPPRVDPRPSVLIVCEGEKTEHYYFRSFRQKEPVRLLQIEISHSNSDPESVVRHAVQLKAEADRRAERMHDDNERLDEVWCVVDVDTHAGLDKAMQFAAAKGINMAVSNPCFDLWILLHVKDHRSELKSQAAKSECKKAIPHYSGVAPFEKIWDQYSVAVARAKRLDERHKGHAIPGNPGTRVYLLTELLRELGRSHALKRQLRLTGRK